jgi:hypothetical protein
MTRRAAAHAALMIALAACTTPPDGSRADPPEGGDPRRTAAERADSPAAARAETPAGARPEPAGSADTLPYRIVSPAAGTVWREGETHVIRWTRGREDAVNVGAVVGGKDKGHLAFALSAEADSLVWQVPVGFVTGFGPDRSDAVRIRVESADDPRIGAESASFTIAGDTAATTRTPP